MKAPFTDPHYREPPDRKSMHGRIVRDLGMRIVSGELKPGDRLPSEASLCADYDVSRPVLREATRVLVAKGLVLSRQRAGATVRAQSDWHLLDPDVLYWLIQSKPQGEFVETLLTVRRIFEPAAAALAAQVASDAAIDGIASAYAAMEAAPTPEALLEPDLAFPILTALQHRDPLGARQATLVQLEETKGDLSVVLDTPNGQNVAASTDRSFS
ncbi:MAG: hypothetical protein RL260_1462 [Pseudomonadota bacterium]